MTERIWQVEPRLEALGYVRQGTIVGHVGIEVTEIGPDFLRGTMPCDARTLQPEGILHGGASVVLAETLASIAANLCVDPRRFVCFGQEINANHLRPVSKGLVTGTARPFHLGKRSQVWGIEMQDEQGKLTCVARITMAVVERQQGAYSGKPASGSTS